HPGAEAAALVARDASAVVAEGGGAALEQPAVPAVRLVGHRPDAELRLDALEVRTEIGLARARDAVTLGPLVEDVVGRAVARPRVDRRGAADATAQRVRDGRTPEGAGHAAVTEEEIDHLPRVRAEVPAGEEPALLEEDDVLAARRELAGYDRAARSRAAAHDVGVPADVLGHRGAVAERCQAPRRAARAAALGPAG